MSNITMQDHDDWYAACYTGDVAEVARLLAKGFDIFDNSVFSAFGTGIALDGADNGYDTTEVVKLLITALDKQYAARPDAVRVVLDDALNELDNSWVNANKMKDSARIIRKAMQRVNNPATTHIYDHSDIPVIEELSLELDPYPLDHTITKERLMKPMSGGIL